MKRGEQVIWRSGGTDRHATFLGEYYQPKCVKILWCGVEWILKPEELTDMALYAAERLGLEREDTAEKLSWLIDDYERNLTTKEMADKREVPQCAILMQLKKLKRLGLIHEKEEKV